MSKERLALSIEKTNGPWKWIQQKILTWKVAKEKEKFNRIIEKLSTLDKFGGALTVDAFKVISQQMINDGQNGFLIMGDGDNIDQYNQAMGTERVDQYLKETVFTIYNILSQNGITVENSTNIKNSNSARVGKMGDEFYIYIPQKLQEEQLLQIIKQLKSNKGMIPITYAFARIQEGLDLAISQAEQKIEIAKDKKQVGLFMKQQSQNIDETVQAYIDCAIKTLRLIEKNATKDDIQRINENMKKAITRIINKEEIPIDKKEIVPDITLAQINELEKQLQNKYRDFSLSQEFINEYVLAKTLSKKPIKNTKILTESGFKQIKISEQFKGRNRKQIAKMLSQYSIIQVEVSKIKKYNEEHGHNACDQEVYSDMSNIDSIFREVFSIQGDGFCRGISSLYYFIPADITQEHAEIAQKRLDEYELNSPFAFNCSNPVKLVPDGKIISFSKYKRESIPEIIKEIIEQAQEKTNIQVRAKSAKKKREDIDAMSDVLENNLQKLMLDPIIVQYIHEYSLTNKLSRTEAIKKVLSTAIDNTTKKEIESHIQEEKINSNNQIQTSIGENESIK